MGDDARSTVKKAVIPAAGLGTRFLPATKSQPKEMLPVVDKPSIQYVVEEAVAAGLTDILIITGRGKRAIEDHFDRNFELEYRLKRDGKTALLEAVAIVVREEGLSQVSLREVARDHGVDEDVLDTALDLRAIARGNQTEGE